MRQALIPLDLTRASEDNSVSAALKRRLLEDAVIMYLERVLGGPPSNRVIEYDSRSGDADFVIIPDGSVRHSIVIEVGYQKKRPGRSGRQ